MWPTRAMVDLDRRRIPWLAGPHPPGEGAVDRGRRWRRRLWRSARRGSGGGVGDRRRGWRGWHRGTAKADASEPLGSCEGAADPLLEAPFDALAPGTPEPEVARRGDEPGDAVGPRVGAPQVRQHDADDHERRNDRRQRPALIPGEPRPTPRGVAAVNGTASGIAYSHRALFFDCRPDWPGGRRAGVACLPYPRSAVVSSRARWEGSARRTAGLVPRDGGPDDLVEPELGRPAEELLRPSRDRPRRRQDRPAVAARAGAGPDGPSPADRVDDLQDR